MLGIPGRVGGHLNDIGRRMSLRIRAIIERGVDKGQGVGMEVGPDIPGLVGRWLVRLSIMVCVRVRHSPLL